MVASRLIALFSLNLKKTEPLRVPPARRVRSRPGLNGTHVASAASFGDRRSWRTTGAIPGEAETGSPSGIAGKQRARAGRRTSRAPRSWTAPCRQRRRYSGRPLACTWLCRTEGVLLLWSRLACS